MNAYILLGPELGKKQDALSAIKKKTPAAEEFVFYYGETSAGAICDIIQNRGLFAEKQIVIVKNADTVKKKDEVELLASCIKNMDENTSLVFISDELKIAAGLEDAVPKANRQVFYEMFEREKSEWVKQFFIKEGINLEKDSISAVLELVENNTEALRRECSRLVYFLPKDSPVKPQEIEKWLSHNREESAFTLFSRIAAGDISKALESVSVMLAAKESAQSILAGLAWCFRKLIDYLSLLETQTDINPFELKKIGLSSPKAKDDYTAASKRYSIDGAEGCLALTAEYDILLRSPVAPLGNILMDMYIIAVFRRASDNYQ